MTIEAFKKNHRSCWADLQYIGLITAGCSALNKKMRFGGKYTEQIEGTPLTGQVVLPVTMGGLRTKETPPEVKMLFKKEVVPVLVENLSGFGQKYSGKIVLHFNEGVLTNLNLTT